MHKSNVNKSTLGWTLLAASVLHVLVIYYLPGYQAAEPELQKTVFNIRLLANKQMIEPVIFDEGSAEQPKPSPVPETVEQPVSQEQPVAVPESKIKSVIKRSFNTRTKTPDERKLPTVVDLRNSANQLAEEVGRDVTEVDKLFTTNTPLSVNAEALQLNTIARGQYAARKYSGHGGGRFIKESVFGGGFRCFLEYGAGNTDALGTGPGGNQVALNGFVKLRTQVDCD